MRSYTQLRAKGAMQAARLRTDEAKILIQSKVRSCDNVSALHVWVHRKVSR